VSKYPANIWQNRIILQAEQSAPVASSHILLLSPSGKVKHAGTLDTASMSQE